MLEYGSDLFTINLDANVENIRYAGLYSYTDPDYEYVKSCVRTYPHPEIVTLTAFCWLLFCNPAGVNTPKILNNIELSISEVARTSSNLVLVNEIICELGTPDDIIIHRIMNTAEHRVDYIRGLPEYSHAILSSAKFLAATKILKRI